MNFNFLIKPAELFLSIFVPSDDSLKIIIQNEFIPDYKDIQKLVFTPSWDLSTYEQEFLSRMREKYQWGEYKVSHLYNISTKKLRKEYQLLHKDICHLLHD